MTMNPGDLLFLGVPALIGAAYLTKRPRRNQERPLRESLDQTPILFAEGVTAKWTLPSGAWSGRTSRGMRVEVRSGYVSVVLASRFLRAALGTEQYFPASDITMAVTEEPSVGWPRRTWVVLTPTGAAGRPVAVATRGDPQALVAALAAGGVRQTWW